MQWTHHWGRATFPQKAELSEQQAGKPWYTMVRENRLLNGEHTLLYMQPSTSCSLLCPGIRDSQHHRQALHQTSFCLRPNGASALDYLVMATISMAACLAKGGPCPIISLTIQSDKKSHLGFYSITAVLTQTHSLFHLKGCKMK